MPLVRIDIIEGRTPEQVRALADGVHDALLATFATPERDRYQVVTEHRPGHIIAEDTGLGFERSRDVVVVQVFQQGRTEQQKRDLYGELARSLQERVGLAPTDLIISVVENTPADWSFGLGRAQFLEGDL